MANLSEVAIQKLRTVKEQIMAQPEFYDQRQYYGSSVEPCGSACCLAGWLVWNESAKQFRNMATSGSVQWYERALEILNIEHAGHSLFGAGVSWPSPFDLQLESARTSEARAKVAAARIEHFIATDGRE